MIEVSIWLLTLLVEALAISLVVIVISMVLFLKRKKRDRLAVKKLVRQIKNQSKTRMETTSSFVNEKYRIEGNELEKAVKLIDKAEKKFMQHIIHAYVNRSSDELISMDASMAEMIDTYKSLSPVMPHETATDNSETLKELAELKETNARLTEELRITKETMSNMINEFGNMFGGGKNNELDESQVVEKVIPKEKTRHPDNGIEQQVTDTDATMGTHQQADSVSKSIDPASDPSEKKTKNVDVDELLNSIDLSDDK